MGLYACIAHRYNWCGTQFIIWNKYKLALPIDIASVVLIVCMFYENMMHICLHDPLV